MKYFRLQKDFTQIDFSRREVHTKPFELQKLVAGLLIIRDISTSMTMLLRVTLSASLLLLLSSLTSVTEARDRGSRSSRLGSIWDVILPPKKSSLQARDDIQTNKINVQGNMKSAARGCIENYSRTVCVKLISNSRETVRH